MAEHAVELVEVALVLHQRGARQIVEILHPAAGEIGLHRLHQGEVFAQRHRHAGRFQLMEEGDEHAPTIRPIAVAVKICFLPTKMPHPDGRRLPSVGRTGSKCRQETENKQPKNGLRNFGKRPGLACREFLRIGAAAAAALDPACARDLERLSAPAIRHRRLSRALVRGQAHRSAARRSTACSCVAGHAFDFWPALIAQALLTVWIAGADAARPRLRRAGRGRCWRSLPCCRSSPPCPGSRAFCSPTFSPGLRCWRCIF